MKRKVLVIAILAIVLIVSLAVMQGCGKKKTDEVKPPIKTETTQPTEQTQETTQQTQQTAPEEVPPEKSKDYELQVAASPSYANIITEKNKLAQYGYETKITTTKRDGKLFYRLRLKGLYSAPEANELGKQLKAKFPSISDYWLAKVK